MSKVTVNIYGGMWGSGIVARDYPADYEVQANMNFPSVLTMPFRDDWFVRSQETLGPNTIQARNYVEVIDEGEYVFRGYIHAIDRSAPTSMVTAYDKLKILDETLARLVTGDSAVHNIWARWTGSEAITTVRLYPSPTGGVYDSGPYNIWYPKYDSSAWKTAGSDLQITLAATFASGDAEIDIGASDDAAAAPPEGFATITHGGSLNMIQYRGKAYDPATSTYKIYNCKHGRNGSTSTAGSIGEVLYFRFPKRIHFDRAPRIRGFVTAGSVYETINPELYDILAAEGGFGFKTDPLNLRRKTGGATDAFDQIIADAYNVYAEEDATKQLLLSDLLSDVIRVAKADYGPGLSVAISISPDIVLSRVECPKSTTVLDFIRGLLQDTILQKGSDNDAVGIWYDPVADTINVKSIAQLASTSTSTLHYTGETAVASSIDMDGVYSAVACDYLNQGSGNLLASRRVWHPVGGTGGGTAPYVFHIANGTPQQTGAAYGGTNSSINLLYPNNTRLVTLLTAAGNALPELILDNNTDTGIILGWDNASDATNKVIYFWFDGSDEITPGSKWIGEVGALLDMSTGGASATTGAKFTVFYYDDLAPNADSAGSATVPASTNGAQYLDARLTLEYGGGVCTETARALTADGMLMYGNAIGIKLEQPLEFVIGGTTYYGIKLLDIYVKPPPLASVIFALANAYSTGSLNYLTAPDSYAKILGVPGAHKVGLLSVGGASKQAAEYLAFLQLVQGLTLTEAPMYDLADRIGFQWSGYPKLSKTAYFSDGKGGVTDSFTIGRQKGVRVARSVRVVNFNAGIFGDRQ